MNRLNLKLFNATPYIPKSSQFWIYITVVTNSFDILSNISFVIQIGIFFIDPLIYIELLCLFCGAGEQKCIRLIKIRESLPKDTAKYATFQLSYYNESLTASECNKMC